MFNQSNSQIVKANYRHYVLDIAWFGLALSATTRFLQIYAIRVLAYSDVPGWLLSQVLGEFEGSTAGQITEVLSYMTALPAIVMMFATTLSGRWRRGWRNSTEALWLPSFGFRLVFILPAFTSLVPAELRPIWLILAVTLPALPQGIAGSIFLVKMRESIPNERLSALLSQRAMAMNVGLGISALGFGLLLQILPFPANYQTMFVLSFVFTMISMWHVWKVRIIVPVPPPYPHRPTLNFWRAPGFASAIIVILGTHITFFSVYPITPAHLVNNLHADEAFMTVFALVELVVGAVIAARTHYIVDRIGYANLIALSMVGTGVSAFIFALAPSLPLTLLGSAISGAAWTAVGIGVFGYFIEHTPSEDMTRYSMAYMQLIGLGTFVGPLIGNWLINSGLEIVSVLLIGAIMRLLSGVFIQYNPLETEAATPSPQFTPTHSGKKSSVSASRSA